MPELPEVEQFRQVLLPLVSTSDPLCLELLPDTVPPKVWISSEQIATLQGECYCTDVLRRGKQLCLVLEKRNKGKTVEMSYLFLHMGMTGSIRSPGKPMGWGHEGRTTTDKEEEDNAFPPKYAYLILKNSSYQAVFCDPRKFGKVELASTCAALDMLAPDAWQGPVDEIIPRVSNQSTGIKALLLDQKRACAGVGNWVADEVLYQCCMHPDQAYLTVDEATTLITTLQTILGIAVDCLAQHIPYPTDWLFGYRWTKKKAGKDAKGRSITFVQSGGRTTALIASQQKLYKRKRATNGDEPGRKAERKRAKKETGVKDDVVEQETESNAKAKLLKEEVSSTDSSKRKSTKGRRSKSKSAPSSREEEQSSALFAKSNKEKVAKDTLATPSEESRRRSPRFVSP